MDIIIFKEIKSLYDKGIFLIIFSTDVVIEVIENHNNLIKLNF
jgi:hypothetical protein